MRRLITCAIAALVALIAAGSGEAFAATARPASVTTAAATAPRTHHAAGYVVPAAMGPGLIKQGTPGSTSARLADDEAAQDGRLTLQPHDGTVTDGENPPGRVSNQTGLAGYYWGDSANENLQATFTIPSVTPTNPPDSHWPSVSQSEISVFLANGGVGVQLLVERNGTSVGDSVFSNLDSRCTYYGCPAYQPGFYVGDSIEMWLDTSADGSTGGFIDLTNGNTMSWSGPSASANAQGLVGEEDYCGYPSPAPCSELGTGMEGPPPNFLNYGAISFSGATVNGEALGQAFSDAGFTYWAEADSLFTDTYDAETQYLGTGGSFLVTATDELLPSASVTAGPPDNVDRPTTGANAQLTFTVNLSFGSTETIYVDYATSPASTDPDGQGQPAVGGDDYTDVSGTLTFAPGATSEQVQVPVLAGADNGGDRLFTFAIFNPSFTYITTGSVNGTIHEGPVVYGVASSPVPLNGGGASLTVTGADFGPTGTRDAVDVCDPAGSGSQACVRASDVTVQSDTTITFTAPDASPLQPSNGGVFPVDTIVTNPKGVASPTSDADLVDYGCDTESAGIGSYTVNGCLTPETYDNSDVTEGNSTIDGALQVTGTTKDATTYTTTPGAGAVASQGNTTVSLQIAGQLFKLFQGKLNASLSAPLTFSIPNDTKLLGMELSGQMTLTPNDAGSAMGNVTVTLPGILGAPASSGASTGGATGTLSFVAAAGNAGGVGSVSNVQISIPGSISFMNMFSVSGLSMSFSSPGTWMISGSATSGGGTTGNFSGSLVYAGNTLTAASLSISSIPVAGLLTVSNFQVNYASGAWTGSGTVTQTTSTGTEQATIKVAINAKGVMTSGSIATGPVTLFGVLNLDSFELDYASGTWSVKLKSTIGGTATNAALSVANGVIQSGSVTIGKVQFLSGLSINQASLTYAASATTTPAGCTTVGSGAVTGSQVWCGSLSVTLPGAGQTIAGFVAFASGTFQAGGFNLSGINVPLLDGVFLTSIGAGVNLPSGGGGLTVQGTAGVTFGPTVDGSSLLSATGSVTLNFAGSSGSGGSYIFAINQLTGPGGLLLGSGSVTLPDSGAAQFSATLGTAGSGISLAGGTVSIAGSLSGTFTSNAFKISGTGTTTIAGNSLNVSYEMDNLGIAGCTLINSKIGSLSAGFQYTWSTGATTTYLTPTKASHCSFTGY